jgi:hypothetical protein
VTEQPYLRASWRASQPALSYTGGWDGEALATTLATQPLASDRTGQHSLDEASDLSSWEVSTSAGTGSALPG